jgi:hypothetical protein
VVRIIKIPGLGLFKGAKKSHPYGMAFSEEEVF